MVIFGAAAIIAPLIGKLSQIPIFIIFYICVLGVSIFLLLWTSYDEQTNVLFLIAFVFAIIEAINIPQTRALYGSLFKNKTMFSVLNLYQGCGFLIGFLMSNFYCIKSKVYVMIVVCSVSIVCHIIIELNRRRKINDNKFLDLNKNYEMKF